MDLVRHHLANLSRHDELQPGLVDVYVVDFSLRVLYRVVKGRVYDKPLHSLDSILQEAYEQQQLVSITHAETIQNPYQDTPFSHQYLHIYPLKQGLLLIQQDDFHPLPASILLMAQSIDIVLEASVNESKLAVYEDWLRRSGMNEAVGEEAFQEMKYTPHLVPTYQVDPYGCYPIQAMPEVRSTDSVVYVSVSDRYLPILVKTVEIPVYRFVEGVYLHVATTDKRRLNKIVATIRSIADEPFSELTIHVVRGCDTKDVTGALQQMHSSSELYYPPRPLEVVTDVDVALAQMKRYRVRNQAHQWVMTYYELPSMSLGCERAVLQSLLKEKTSTFRLIPLSKTFTLHPDSVRWMNKHKMAQYMNKTGFIMNQSDQALRTYLTQKSGTIGCSHWDVYFNEPRDYFLLNRGVTDTDSSLIELLFDRQMKQRVIPIVPVRSTQDILVLTNHQLGYYYNEEDHE